MEDPYAQLADPHAAQAPTQAAPTSQPAPSQADPYAHLADPYAGLADPTGGHPQGEPKPDDSLLHLSDYDRDAIRRRMGLDHPGGYLQNIKERLGGLPEGVVTSIVQKAATVDHMADDLYRKVFGEPAPGAKPSLLGKVSAREQAFLDAQHKRKISSERAGGQELGSDIEDVMEFYLADHGLSKLGLFKKMEALGPLGKVLKENPIAAEVMRNTIRRSAIAGTQTGLEGGDTGDVLTSAGLTALLEGTADLPNARIRKAGRIAGELKPNEVNIGGKDFLQLRSEAMDPVTGESTATKLQRGAAEIKNQPDVRGSNEAARKDLHTDLSTQAADKIASIINAFAPPSTAAPELSTEPVGHAQRAGKFAPKTVAGTPTTLPEIYQGVRDLEEMMNDPEISDRRKQGSIKNALDHLNGQIEEHKQWQKDQPKFGPLDGADLAANGTHFGTLAERLHAEADARLRHPNVGDAEVHQAGYLKLFAEAMDALQGGIDKHMNVPFSEEKNLTDIGKARTSRNMGTFTKTLADVRDQHGDVLDNLLGPNGLDHVVKAGEMLNVAKGPNAPENLTGEIQNELKRRASGIGHGFGNFGLYTLLHSVAGLSLPLAALGEAGLSGGRKHILRRMAIDPAFAEQFIQRAQGAQKPKLNGAALAAMLMGIRGSEVRDDKKKEEEKNAAGK